MRRIGFILLLTVAVSASLPIRDLKEGEVISLVNGRNGSFSRTDSVPQEHLDEQSDAYLEGYIQAMIDATYYEMHVLVYVKDRKVILYNLPDNVMLKNSIMSFVQEVPEVESVESAEVLPSDIKLEIEETTVRTQLHGVWFPQNTVLFQPILGDPWEPMYSVSYRWGDFLGAKAIAVSYGDDFPIFRWFDVWKWHGDLQFGITAGVWSVFKMNAQTGDAFSELVNTDYLIGPTLSYAVDKWAFRFRLYHISSHLGDEFMFNHPNFDRVNPSMEAIDFFTSCQLTDAIRFYFGPGWVFHSDDSFKIDPFYVEYGSEMRFFKHKYFYHQLYGNMLFFVNFRNWQENDWEFDSTVFFGYEFSKMQGVGRKIRIGALYHNGYSEGQFFNKRTGYVAFKLSWGF
ncbi:MAG: DUF1207 domain-containing protein [Chlamydiales bacterium]